VFIPKWETCLGGTEWDEGTGIIYADGAYWIVGNTESTDGDISYNHGAWDIWLLNIDEEGNLISEKTFGGSNADGGFVDIKKLNDTVFYIVARTKSNDGDISDNPWPGPEGNYWVLQINNHGDIIWEKVLGGSGLEKIRNIAICNDGGIITLGISTSDDGDITEHFGDYDLWMIKLNSFGVKQWDLSLGGIGYESGGSVKQTEDNGFIVVGTTHGEGGGNYDTTCNFHGTPGGGFVDGWIIKLDSSRNIEWQQCYGGSFSDGLSNVLEVEDGYVVIGHTMSNDGDVSGLNGPPGPNSEYGGDIWVFKIDKTGTLIWQNCLGGSYNDYGRNIFTTSDGGFMVVGATGSDDGDVEGYHGIDVGIYEDVWLAKLDSLGNLTYQYCYGGGGREMIQRGVVQKSDFNYVITLGTDTDPWQCGGQMWPDLRVVELFDSTVGIAVTATNSSTIEIYPNPTNSVLKIKLPQNFSFSNAGLELLSINGKTLLRKKLNSVFIELNVSKLNSGLYVIKVQNNRYLITQKFIIK